MKKLKKGKLYRLRKSVQGIDPEGEKKTITEGTICILINYSRINRPLPYSWLKKTRKIAIYRIKILTTQAIVYIETPKGIVGAYLEKMEPNKA